MIFLSHLASNNNFGRQLAVLADNWQSFGIKYIANIKQLKYIYAKTAKTFTSKVDEQKNKKERWKKDKKIKTGEVTNRESFGSFGRIKHK